MPFPLSHIPKAEARAALLSVVIGIALLAAKFFAYFITGSAAIFSDALESIVNVLAAAFALYAVSLAHTPADREHPYGHGKVEFLSAGFEGGMILFASMVIVVQAVIAMTQRGGPRVEANLVGLVTLAGAMVSNALLGIYVFRTGRKHGSLTLEADGKHLLADAVTSVVALAALGVVAMTKWRYADPIGAIVVALYIARTGLSLLRHSTAGLMDEQDKADAKLLQEILDAHVGSSAREPRICSYHKVRHRHSGRYHWVDFHLVVPGWWDVDRGHKVAGAIEGEIEQALGEGDATAHVEPCVTEDCALCRAARETKGAAMQGEIAGDRSGSMQKLT